MPSQYIAPRRAARRARASLVAGVLAVAALVAACAMPTHPDSSAPASDPFNPAATQLIDDTRWTLASWQTADGRPREIAQGGNESRPTLILSTATGQRKASGFSGCNRFAGSYSLKGGTLTFESLVATRMACADPARGELERAYLAALAHIARTGVQWSTPRTLRIVTEDGATLTFVADR
ncbi:META domain-containing protein [Trinickia caryophylli]|uniref:META domain-containing protein n=1 Tax=Trinickia caryophylli TaxID=28094 RepID=A0A1X7GUD7_TRICW|nr:META domain-containing protein [Trinickia caryophylli]PMS08931.1 META domain-containing protein [Trinickia caryophylli]TRX18140.1 META domain-containing protein [Trinickia caryophylli]WQE11076.1 META domain-containing protein [Trinickia caryophylli]SMF74400.1 META domain-containing protein [Trinickia caryophylli]GLU35230.1 META domain-containing protein [Trinickia caryophylli]